MQGTRRPVTRTVPLQLRPELGPAGIPSALRRQHVMIGDAQVSDNPAFQASRDRSCNTAAETSEAGGVDLWWTHSGMVSRGSGAWRA